MLSIPYELFTLLISPQGLATATALIFLAGLSEGAGTRGVVLLVNRITPLAFALGMLASALLYLLSATVWVWGLWLVARELFGFDESLRLFFVALSAAYAPLLLGALALLPMVGPLIRLLLRLWSFAIALGVMSSLGLELWKAAVCALGGALLVAGASALMSEPAGRLVARFGALLTGRPLPLARTDLPRVIPGYAPGEEATR